MRPSTKNTLLLLSTLVRVGSAKAFEAHEWGTFTSLIGSNGITQGGMYHEDEVLPPFVHGFGVTQSSLKLPSLKLFGGIPSDDSSENQSSSSSSSPNRPRPCRGKSCFFQEFYEENTITQKMETPVIYFYSNRTEQVKVNVKFPRGIITETFPAPTSSFPARSEAPVLANGEATFDIKITTEEQNKFPFVESSNIYSHARNVASNAIVSGNEYEKFIFYRGLGQFQPQFKLTSSNDALFIEGKRQSLPEAAFLVHVDASGDTRSIKLGNLGTQRGSQLVDAKTLNLLRNHRSRHPGILDANDSRRALIASLDQAGLKADEATAMIDTWEHGYLKVPGLRLLYILPRSEVDANLPLSMSPAPSKLERVFVGRLEVLTDLEEKQILGNILRDRENFNVNNLGRFSEAILRRIAEVHESGTVLRPTQEMRDVIARLIGRAAVAENVYSSTAH